KGRVRLDPDLELALAERTLAAARPLAEAGKLGAFLLQLSPAFAPSRDLRALAPLVDALAPHAVAVELRHRAWASSDRSERALEAGAEEIRAHRGCGFEPCETCQNPVPGEGSATADVVFVGEAPGAREDKDGRPFVGAAGKLLDELLASIGLERGDVFITNVL